VTLDFGGKQRHVTISSSVTFQTVLCERFNYFNGYFYL
jgi:hypothetical protein